MARQAVFTISLSKSYDQQVTVDYATQDGTATTPSDYTAVSGTLTFEPGEVSKTVAVPVRDAIEGNPAEAFRLVLSNPSGGTLGTATGTATIPAGDTPEPVENAFAKRFNAIYDLIHDDSGGYFGPPSGENARKIPYHSLETVIVEAPDWGHESVSETASFYVKLEAWKAALTGDTSGYAAAWDCVEKYFIPDADGQPWGTYSGSPAATYSPDVSDLAASPAPLLSQGVWVSPSGWVDDAPFGEIRYAGYANKADAPEGSTYTETWTEPNGTQHHVVQAGDDPLLSELTTAYGTKSVYLMHWLWDVDGVYGFKNATGGKTMVPINNFQRGPAEDGWMTITHPCWDDFENGGQVWTGSGSNGEENNAYGFQQIYNRTIDNTILAGIGTDWDGLGRDNQWIFDPFVAGFKLRSSAQWNYSVAPDAESRCIQGAWIAHSMGDNLNVTTQTTKAKKMADYMQYALFDKYFRGTQAGAEGNKSDGCHYLLSWGAGFGGGMPNQSVDHISQWGFRIGNSEIHFGYNCVDVAYLCQTGKPLKPNTASSGGRYAISVNRQLELIRWLQSPEGPIAGGVTSNYKGDYATPTDGRQNATFYGLYYNYSPSWHNPPSNNWSGYQVWGLERVSHLFTIVADSSVKTDKDLASNCAVILDRWMNWAWDHFLIDEAGVITMPTVLRWVEDSASPGTATQPNTEGTYEYLPTLKWDSNGDYAAFWSGSSVPNPNLHCEITEIGLDLGVAAGFVQIVVQYCYAKKVINGDLTSVIPNGTATYQQLFDRAIAFLDTMWENYQDEKGFGVVEPMAAFNRLNDKLFIPKQYGKGYMPDGSVMQHDVTTFLSMRQFYKKTAIWPEIQSYLDGGPVPSQKYHRFWAQVDVAVSYAMLAKFFPEAAPAA